MNAYVAAQATSTARIIAGLDDVPVCGDGEVNAVGEHCDGAALDGYTCLSLGYDGGALACAACDFDVADCIMCPSGGFGYSGACWYFGADFQSCDTVCAGHSLVYDTATLSVAGSGGTDAACKDVLDGVGAPGSVVTSVACISGGGCAEEDGTRLRCTSPATNSTTSAMITSRVCACQ